MQSGFCPTIGFFRPTARRGGQYGTVNVWEASSGRLLVRLLGHTGIVFGTAFSGEDHC